VNLYELNFVGGHGDAKFEPPEYFDFHEFQRDILKRLRRKHVKARIRLYYRSELRPWVDLCYSVDSLIYLPMYLAGLAGLFESHGVRVNYYVSPDGILER